MNIDKDAHEKVIMEVIEKFGIKELADKAYEDAVIRYNSGGEGRSYFYSGDIELEKIRDISPFPKNDDDNSACNSANWFQEIIKQYLNSIGICEQISYSEIYGEREGFCIDTEFTAVFRINIT